MTFYASGGNDNVRYLVSHGSFMTSAASQINSGFKRLSFLSNLDLRLTPKVNAFTRLNLAYNKQQAISGTNIQGLDVDPKETPTVYPGRGSIAEQLTCRRSVMYVPATGCSTPVSPSYRLHPHAGAEVRYLCFG